jgi:hypothetical protein
MIVLYLDTNHISRLGRSPDDVPCQAILELLQSGACRLGLNWLHLQELSAPEFKSRGAVGAVLDQVPVAWAPSPDEVFDREIRWGIELALYGEPIRREIFSVSFEHAMGAPPEANIPISQMLEALAERPDLRTHLSEAARYGANADTEFKRAAAVVRNAEEPILAHIRDLGRTTTRSGIRLPRPYPPEDILRKAGGVAGFPAINVAHSLSRTRLKDESYPAAENDIMDEWHACYLPYCAAMALDRRTAARFRMTRLPGAHLVTHVLEEIPAILNGLT